MGQSIQEWTKQKFLEAAFHKFYLVHSWMYCHMLLIVEICLFFVIAI